MGCKVFKDREKGMVRGCKGEKKGKREGKGCAHVHMCTLRKKRVMVRVLKYREKGKVMWAKV